MLAAEDAVLDEGHVAATLKRQQPNPATVHRDASAESAVAFQVAADAGMQAIDLVEHQRVDLLLEPQRVQQSEATTTSAGQERHGHLTGSSLVRHHTVNHALNAPQRILCAAAALPPNGVDFAH